GGFVGYGGFLGGVAGVLLYDWRKGIAARWTMELTAAPLALGYALGRVGCFLVNDDYGVPSSLPWAMKFPDGLPPTRVADLQQQLHVTFPPGTNPTDLVAVQPTQLYETALMMLAFWVLWRLRDHRHATGWRFGVYLVLAGAERFLVEFVRAKDDRLLGPFTLAQATSVLLVVVGIYVMQRLRQPDAAALASPVSTTLTPIPARSCGAPSWRRRPGTAACSRSRARSPQQPASARAAPGCSRRSATVCSTTSAPTGSFSTASFRTTPWCSKAGRVIRPSSTARRSAPWGSAMARRIRWAATTGGCRDREGEGEAECWTAA